MQAAALFGLDQININPLDGFENFAYETSRNGQPFILRISDGTRRNADMMRAELDWLSYLANSDVLVLSRVVRRARGEASRNGV